MARKAIVNKMDMIVMTAISSISVKDKLLFTFFKLCFISVIQAGRIKETQSNKQKPIIKSLLNTLIRPIGKQANTMRKATIDNRIRIFINSFLIIKYKTFKLNYLLQSAAKIVRLEKCIRKTYYKHKLYR